MCPVCKIDHHGQRCPKLPSFAMAQMRQKLAMEARMAPTLEAFVRKVYDSPDLMAGGDDLAYRVYDLYSGGAAGGGAGASDIASKHFYINISGAVPEWIGRGYLQRNRVSFADLLWYCKKAEPLPAGYLSDFLYFNIDPGHIVCRLYLNVQMGGVSAVFWYLKKYIGLHPANNGVVDVKTTGPASVAQRADVIVVYCSSTEAAQALGAAINTCPERSLFRLNTGVPGMTTYVSPGVGIAIGAEPKPQATGMGFAAREFDFTKGAKNEWHQDPELRNSQSFGTIRSQLIAMAILNYNVNKPVYGASFESFKKFVCTAFTGYGLDPMRPGN
jgi:hypothetical protein